MVFFVAPINLMIDNTESNTVEEFMLDVTYEFFFNVTLAILCIL